MQSFLVSVLAAAGAARGSNWSSEDQEHQLARDFQRLSAKLEDVTSLVTATVRVRDMLAGNKTLISELLGDGQSGASARNELQANVESLESELGDLQRNVTAAQSELPRLKQDVRADQQCKKNLEKNEGELADARALWAKTAREYSAADIGNSLNPAYGEMWNAADQVQMALYNLSLVQKKCAPADVEIATVSPPPQCTTDTGGSCLFFPCWKYRNATECTRSGLEKKCLCGAGWCSHAAPEGWGGGICSPRGQPPMPPGGRFRIALVDGFGEGLV